nr:dockerin type I repeat-containing protein [Ruminococcus difficilis]
MGPNPQDAPTLKTLVYKSDFSYENEYYDIDYLIRYKYSYDSSLPKPAIEKIFVPPATIERWKRNVANEYKDKILPLYLLGDVDGNCDIEIRDATFIQRKIAGINLPFTFNKKTADVDGNNDITIMDVTFFTKASGTYESIVQNRRAGILK